MESNPVRCFAFGFQRSSIGIGLSLGLSCAAAGPVPADRVQAHGASASTGYAQLPLTFIENRGQTDARVRYHVQGPRHAFHLTREGIVLSFVKDSPVAASPALQPLALGAQESAAPKPARPMTVAHSRAMADRPSVRAATLALRFVGANPGTTLEGQERRAAHIHFLRGNDASQWHTAVPGYAQVTYRELWTGVDMLLRGEAGSLKYEFRVRPGARFEDIRLAYAGAQGLSVDRDGALLIDTPIGVLRDTAPVSFQIVEGVRVPVESRYVLEQRGDAAVPQYGFELGAGYRKDHELIIDPGLAYSTFLGGSSAEGGAGIAVDAAGNAYIVGTTQSTNFPATSGAFDTTPGDSVNGPDAFVAKLNASGTALIYATYLGGSGADFGRAIAIDSAGNAYVTGKTQSANFPTTSGAFDRSANIPATPRPQVIDDGFVAKLNATGSALLYSTYLGGTDNDEPRAIAIDGAGNAHVTGETVSSDFPVTAGAFNTSRGGEYDAFVSKLNSSGSALIYSTFLGGAAGEIANGIAVDSAGNAIVIGATGSAGFPTTAGALDTTYNGGADIFVSKFNASGTGLLYSTFLGGAQGDEAMGLALDSAGNLYLSGATQSPDFPTTAGAYDTVYPGAAGAGFVAKLNAAGSALVYSTFLRGANASAIAVDSAGNVWVTGGTTAEDMPVTLDAFDLSFNGVTDAFVAGLNASGSALLYSTFLGGSIAEYGTKIALDAAGNVYITGTTYSSDFPTSAGALDRVFNGDPSIFWGDGFIAKFDVSVVAPAWPGPTLAGLSLNPGSVTAGAPATGTVTLSSAALIGGAVVTLADDSASVSVPASVTVPAGASSATFAVSTNAASAFATAAKVSGTLGTLRSASLTVQPAPALLQGVSVSPSSVVGGNPATATVSLSAAQSSPTVISIDPPQASAPASMPTSVTVPAGATSASFTITTTPVTSTFNLGIGVRLQGAGSPGPSALLLIAPPANTSVTLSSLALSASTVVGGGFLTGTVALSGAAPSGGAVVTLSDNSAAATAPSSVTVPEGATSTTFILTSTVVSVDTPVTLNATFNGTVRSLVLTVLPAPPAVAALSSIVLSPSSVVGGTASSATVNLTAAAPGGGAVVALSSNSAAAAVQANVTVAAGATSASVTVTTTSVSTATSATLSAVYAGVTRSATLMVNPPAAPSALPAPSLRSPSSDSRFSFGQTINFDWSDVTGAARYEIQIDDSSSFTLPLTHSALPTVSAYATNSLPRATLRWRVRALAADGTPGAWSSTRRFEVR
jgi:Beta-propeller repeat